MQFKIDWQETNCFQEMIIYLDNNSEKSIPVIQTPSIATTEDSDDSEAGDACNIEVWETHMAAKHDSGRI